MTSIQSFPALLLIIVASCYNPTAGHGFLDPTVRDIDLSLETELNARGAMKERIKDFMEVLSASFAALPKNQAGNLEHQTARYMLHRLFVQRHGWYIKGLEPNGDVFHVATSPESFKQWVPSFLFEHLEERLGHKGIDLYDLSILAAALEDLAQQEVADLMTRLFDEMQILKKSSTKSPSELAREVARVYFMSFLSGKSWELETLLKNQDRFTAEYFEWNRTELWFQNLAREHLAVAGNNADVGVAAKIGIDIGARFGEFNDGQCNELKGALMGMWPKAQTTGRIRLSDFYKVGLETQWFLSEKKEYLRSIGALDESNATLPLVIIPNYLTARPNCMDATSLYEICCRNECEDILGLLEQSIAAPSATPERIVELVSQVASSTVEAPRALDVDLLVRLGQIADYHNHSGEVKLHGRLFAQWLHHAYPNECPYPHEAGTADPSSPDEWLVEDVSASEEERRAIVEAETCGPEEAAVEWTVEVPWSHAEELLPHHAPQQVSNPGVAGRVCMALRVAAFAAGIVIAVMHFLQIMPGQKIPERQAAILALALVAVITNLVNPILLAVMISLGLLMQRVLAVMLTTKKKEVSEKCVC